MSYMNLRSLNKYLKKQRKIEEEISENIHLAQKIISHIKSINLFDDLEFRLCALSFPKEDHVYKRLNSILNSDYVNGEIKDIRAPTFIYYAANCLMKRMERREMTEQEYNHLYEISESDLIKELSNFKKNSKLVA